MNLWPSPMLAAAFVAAFVAGFGINGGGLLAASDGGGDLRLNEIQVLGSHNSYKLAMSGEKYAALRLSSPEIAESLEYSHISLPAQLDMGIRKIELDVFYDPAGELFPTVEGTGSQFPVLHVQNLDDRSSCADLVACLSQIRAWSDSHLNHVPIFISFNAKDAVIDRPGFVRPLPFEEDAWAAMDAEIRTILGDRLITPPSVIGDAGVVWPLLDEVRGGFVAVLDEGGDKRASYARRWRDRAMFANLPEAEPGAAIMIVNDPVQQFDRIQALVRRGYIVRTRADADTREARMGDTRRRDRAFASGAQLISSDYYRPADHFGTGYVVRLPGGMRCTPVLRPGVCEVVE